MKIAFLSSLNPNNINACSGSDSLYHIYRSLKKNNEVKWIGGEELNNINYFHKNIVENSTDFYPEMYAQTFGEIFTEKLRTPDYDIIIACDYFYIAYLNIDIPLIYITDINSHLSNKHLLITDTSFIQLVDDLEKRSIHNAECVLSSSNRAKENIIKKYSADKSKIHVIKFGANLLREPLKHELKFTELSTNCCNLLFTGKNHHNKEEDIAYEAYRLLKERGINCSLTIIGSVPEYFDKNDDSLYIIPFLDKSKNVDNIKLKKIYSNTHFFIAPINWDCYDTIFCTASAYGIPSLTSEIGDTHEVITNGKNGYLFTPNDNASIYADKVLDLFNDKKQYAKLRKSTRKEYDDRLSWDVWLKKTTKIIDKLSQIKSNKFDDVLIPTYVINLKDRTERLQHIEKEFEEKKEFDLNIVEACEHSNGRVGLWNSIVKIINIAIENKHAHIVICEDDHLFTEHYSKEYFIRNLIDAKEQGVDLFSGGIGGFGFAVPTSKNRYWVDWFFCTQFIVVFENFFHEILSYDFKDEDTADGVLSEISVNKMTIYPFVSIQKDFGYSDVTESNNQNGLITQHFTSTEKRLSQIHTITSKLRPILNTGIKLL